MIKQLFENYKKSNCDICEHLETLKKYALECEHITELGMRTGVSTVALAIAQPKKLISCDINYNYQVVNTLLEYARNNNFNFKFIHANDLDIELEETDLLFIDTLHIYEQLKAELKKHGNKSKKYIIFHDTTTFGKFGEFGESPGLMKAVEEFLEENKNWKIKEQFHNNNGLLIIEKQI